MQGFLDDLRFAFRVLARQKALTLVAALTLALGMGTNTAIFSTVSGILWNTLPYPESERLVSISGENRKLNVSENAVSYRDAEYWRPASSLAGLAEYRWLGMAVRGAGDAQSVQAVETSPDFFDVLGEHAALGRTFDQTEQAAGDHRVAVVTEAFWKRELGGDPGAIGREITLDGRLHTVIGIMPPGFDLLYRRAEVFVPVRLTDEERSKRSARSFHVIARLAPGRTVAQADAELEALSRSIAELQPESERGWRGRIRPLEQEVIDNGTRLSIMTMFWAVMGVLLIACGNIASLLLARGTLRQRELAIRASLGAARIRIVRLLLTESLTLALLGGVLGAAFAAWAIPVLRAVAPQDCPRLEFVRLNPAALGYTFLLCVASSLIAGLVPALLLSRGELARTLHQGGRGGTFSRQRLLQSLVGGEVALAMMLMTVTFLLVRTLAGQLYTDPGFEKKGLLKAAVSLPQTLYPESHQQAEFYRRVVETLRRDARIERVSSMQTIPFTGANFVPVAIEGRTENPAEPDFVACQSVQPGFLETLRVPLAAGRGFSDNDGDHAPAVAIINQTMARHFWPDNPDPVGRRLRVAGGAGWMTVVGVARDIRARSPLRPPRREMYLPLAQNPTRRMVVIARAHGDPARSAAAIREAVWAVDRNQPLTLETMEEFIDRRLAGPRVTVQILGFLSALALLLAGLGIYGVLSYLTAQRAREIGIRVALGAVRADIVRLVLSRGILLAGLGLAAGAGLSSALTPALASLLQGVQPHDPASFSLSAAALLAAAVIACAFPVLRALRLDPIRVLRDE